MMKYLLMISIFLYLITTIFPGIQIQYVISGLCMVIVLSTLFYVKWFVKGLGIVFLTLGIMMLATSDVDLEAYLLSFGPMLNLLTLFAIVPILALPIRLGNYQEGMQQLVNKKVKKSGHLYIMTSGVSYFLSIFMNIATLPMTYYSIKPTLNVFPLQNQERFLSRAIIHGFSMPLLWAPVTPIVGIVIEMNGVSWSSMLPYLIPFSIFGLLLDWVLGTRLSSKSSDKGMRYDSARNETAATIETSSGGLNKARRINQIFVAILIFNLLISLIDYFFQFSFLIMVSLLVIPFSLTWSFMLKKGKEFFTGLKEHIDNHLLKMKDQFFTYLSAGFLISAIQYSGTDQLLNGAVGQFKNLIGAEAFLLIIPIIPLILVFTGLHPAVTLALISGALDPTFLGISPHVLTVAMLGGAVTAFLVGPFNGTIGLMSSIINVSPFKISNWNAPFTIIFLVSLMLYLFILNLMI